MHIVAAIDSSILAAAARTGAMVLCADPRCPYIMKRANYYNHLGRQSIIVLQLS